MVAWRCLGMCATVNGCRLVRLITGWVLVVTLNDRLVVLFGMTMVLCIKGMGLVLCLFAMR